MAYGARRLYKAESESPLNWSVNGEPESQSFTLNKNWYETPGIVYKVEGKGSVSESWDVIVCGFIQQQMNLLITAVAMTFLLILIFIALLNNSSKILCTKLISVMVETEDKPIPIIAKLKNCCDKIKALLDTKYIKRLKQIKTYLSNLSIGEILVIIGLEYRGDRYWACCLLTIVILCWFLNGSSLIYFLTSVSYKGLYPRLREKGIKFLIMLALLNQALPTLDQDLEDDKSEKSGDEKTKQKKRLNRNVFSAYALIKSFLIMALTSYIIIQLMGSEHICLPPKNIFGAPDSSFGSSEFQKYSLQSLVPSKTSSFITVKKTPPNSKSFLSWLFGCNKKDVCSCKRWTASIEHCLLARQYPSSLISANTKCYIFDCYQAPCHVQIMLPFALLLKSITAITLAITRKLDNQSSSNAHKVIRFIFMEWTLAATLFVTFYLGDLIQGVMQTSSSKLIIITTFFILVKVISPFYFVQYIRSSKIRGVVMGLWVVLGYFYTVLIYMALIVVLNTHQHSRPELDAS